MYPFDRCEKMSVATMFGPPWAWFFLPAPLLEVIP